MTNIAFTTGKLIKNRRVRDGISSIAITNNNYNDARGNRTKTGSALSR